MTRMVKCAKLQELPGLPYKPFNDALGQRIYDTVSAQAWSEWIEHSKKIVNEYRLDLTRRSRTRCSRSSARRSCSVTAGRSPPSTCPKA